MLLAMHYCAMSTRDLYHNIDRKKVKGNGNIRVIYKAQDKIELCGKIFLDLWEAMLRDFIQGAAIVLPGAEYFCLDFKRLTKKQFIALVKTGTAQNLDFLMSDFTAYSTVASFMKEGKIRNIPFYLNDNMKFHLNKLYSERVKFPNKRKSYEDYLLPLEKKYDVIPPETIRFIVDYGFMRLKRFMATKYDVCLNRDSNGNIDDSWYIYFNSRRLSTSQMYDPYVINQGRARKIRKLAKENKYDENGVGYVNVLNTAVDKTRIRCVFIYRLLEDAKLSAKAIYNNILQVDYTFKKGEFVVYKEDYDLVNPKHIIKREKGIFNEVK